MNLVFMGTPEFAVPSLTRLLADGHRVSAVVTAPDKPRGRGQRPAPTAVGRLAGMQGLTLLAPPDLSDASFAAELAARAPEVIVVVAFRILPESIFRIPSKGIFNLHASLLPKYRGAAPIARAIQAGERETGVTTFVIERAVDTGGIILQERTPIGPDETAGDVHDRLAVIGAELVSRTVRLYERGEMRPRRQNDAAATRAPKIGRDDCRIDWTQSAKRVHDTVRAFSPAPGAWTTLDGKVLKLLRTRVAAEKTSGAPGAVVRASGDACVVATGDGAVELRELMIEGRNAMGIDAFLRGRPMPPGTTLGA